MNRFTQTLLNFLIERASGIVGQLTTVPAMVLMDAYPEVHGGIKLWKSLAGDLGYLVAIGLITSPLPGIEGHFTLAGPDDFIYTVTKAGLRAKTVEAPEAPLKTWRQRDQEAENEKRRVQTGR
jgi:hypothetical protein